MRWILLILMSSLSYWVNGQDLAEMLGQDEKTIRKLSKKEFKLTGEEEIKNTKVLKFRDRYLPSEYTYYIDKESGRCKIASIMSLDEKLMEKMYTTIKENFEKVADKEYRIDGVRYVLIPPTGYFVKREEDMNK